MKSVPVWVYYSVLRVLMFAVPLGVLLSMQIKWWIAALVAALIGFCLSYIFLRKSRESMSRELYEARHRDKAPVATDDESEDAAVDRASAQTADAASTGTASADTASADTASTDTASTDTASTDTEHSVSSERESRSE